MGKRSSYFLGFKRWQSSWGEGAWGLGLCYAFKCALFSRGLKEEKEFKNQSKLFSIAFYEKACLSKISPTKRNLCIFKLDFYWQGGFWAWLLLLFQVAPADHLILVLSLILLIYINHLLCFVSGCKDQAKSITVHLQATCSDLPLSGFWRRSLPIRRFACLPARLSVPVSFWTILMSTIVGEYPRVFYNYPGTKNEQCHTQTV